jgi:CRP-like cAMP-binding protein
MNELQTAALQMFVNRLTSRSVLTDEEVEALLGLNGNFAEVAPRLDFVRYGESVDHACLIVKGLAGRYGQHANGTRQITCLHIPGDMADLPSVVSPKSGWGLSALTATTLLRIPHADLRRVAAKHPGIAEAFWRDCVADGSIFSEWVVNVGRRDAISRVAHVFCQMALRYERLGQGNRHGFRLPMTQTDLADATGLTSVHVNRTLRLLRVRSIVDLRAGTVTVHDWDKMVTTGDFDAGFMLLDGPAPRLDEAA